MHSSLAALSTSLLASRVSPLRSTGYIAEQLLAADMPRTLRLLGEMSEPRYSSPSSCSPDAAWTLDVDTYSDDEPATLRCPGAVSQ